LTLAGGRLWDAYGLLAGVGTAIFVGVITGLILRCGAEVDFLGVGVDQTDNRSYPVRRSGS